MNASSLSCFRKGAVLNPKHAAPSVAMMGKATRLFRRFAVSGALKVGTFAARQCGALFSLGFFGSNLPKSALANFFPRFGCSDVISVYSSVSVSKMFFRRQTFKIFNSVVSFVSVDVMNMFARIKRFKPTKSHGAVHKTTTSKHQVPLIVLARSIGKKLSENFSAARNGVKVVEESVFDSVYGYANHAVPSRWLRNLNSNFFLKGMQT